jgi:hypothetical protein
MMVPVGICYLHKCGFVPLDCIFQRFVQDMEIKKMFSPKIKQEKAESVRNDFLHGEIDCLLFNPEWEFIQRNTFQPFENDSLPNRVSSVPSFEFLQT